MCHPNPQARQKLYSLATAGVSSRVLVVRQDCNLSAETKDPDDGLSDRQTSETPGGGSLGGTLKPRLLPLLTSTSTKQICSLAGAACLAAWWLELVDTRLSLPLVCGLAGGCYALLTSPDAQPSNPQEPEPEAMLTLAQFETLGALRVDNYLRFLVTKLAVVWRAIATLHKTATNYSFTVSISDKPSLSELQDLLEGRVPLQLTYDNIKEHNYDKNSRSRGSSLASTVVTDDSYYHRESMDLSGLDDAFEKPAQNEFVALEDQEQVTEYFSIEDIGGWSDSESDEGTPCLTPPSSPRAKAMQVEVTPTPTSEVKAEALQSISVPVLSVESLKHVQKTQTQAAPARKNLDPVVVASIKPLVPDATPVDWHARTEAAALLKRASKVTLKRRISVNVTPMKPLPRLVVKARPSTLTPPQNVQRMLDQVERMMQEVHELLATGRQVLQKVETPEERADRPCRKSVSFNEDVEVIDSSLDMPAEDELELRTSLSYGPDEIESMSNEFFADLSVSSTEC